MANTATIQPKPIDLEDETKVWLDKMDAVEALENIADICIDWDGYRTADGLGGLINEIWACARYCADRIVKKQELRYTPREVRDALMEYGQHDHNIKLGEVIKYNPVQVEDILIITREATKPVIPNMVDWDIYECPKCKTRVDKTYNFCKHCGRLVKW